MLNITKNKLHEKVDLTQYASGKKVFNERNQKYFNRFLIVFGVILIIILLLPWTQTVAGKGYVTTLTPAQRPQTLQSPIPGKIEKWYIREGDFVEKGDTILHISEVKSEYFDTMIVDRTGDQIRVKRSSQESYEEKIQYLSNQVGSLQQERGLKTNQAENKLEQSKLKFKSDSIDLEAARTNYEIAQRQYNRMEALNEEGLKSTAEVENYRLKLQEAKAKEIAQENKVLASRNEIINAWIELNRIQAEYGEKISKTQSDRSTAESDLYQAQADISKLETDFANYDTRKGMYYIRAPQSGYINKAIKAGIGETFKEGEPLVGIMPSDYEIAVETYVDPIDMPLLHIGEKVRVQFDGWPAIVFSGWPNSSYGTYGAEIVAIENFISPNGKYRILLAPDEEEHVWPKEIKIGSGASTLALLEDVSIWYELWRQLNGFPPNYYTPESSTTSNEKKG
ncbi:HlyD family secretion protein [Christiangramia sp. SM2212]|uniref:HlyD family efflux transporter periplasmic adaptor subunit n=1 Tax=Christiangramia sediminicola TaxID=3073267 RepID=A0ABU1EQ56_9FLAO|nr:HlyD family efflux transporter periplasmic adaptor subunit [Christiangramia sp. SM2212]MDR5590523.1 HlyD family efflux transporter periplasmic adaptor subunit [Christiangramia sp. SM2212]